MSKCANCGCNFVTAPESPLPEGLLCKYCQIEQLKARVSSLETHLGKMIAVADAMHTQTISFSLTTPQFKARTKTVTRRLRWHNLKPGDVLMGVEKGMGLKRGQEVVRLGSIKVVSATREQLDQITAEDVVKEGFPGMTPGQFVEMFCKHNNCFETTEVTRIEFEYLDTK